MVSSVHGHGTGDLLDRICDVLPDEVEEEDEGEVIKVAVIGKPNVGKSSLVNKVAGENRCIVSTLPAPPGTCHRHQLSRTSRASSASSTPPVGIKPPTLFLVSARRCFLFHSPLPAPVWRNFQIRSTFGPEGTPVRLTIRQKSDNPADDVRTMAAQCRLTTYRTFGGR